MASLQFETLRWWSVTATLAASNGDRLARLQFRPPALASGQIVVRIRWLHGSWGLIAVPEIVGVLRPDWKCQRQQDQQNSKKSTHKPPCGEQCTLEICDAGPAGEGLRLSYGDELDRSGQKGSHRQLRAFSRQVCKILNRL
jgi:hypothetical protein